MQNRLRPLLALTAVAVLPLFAATGHAGPAGVDVVVEVTNLRSTRGQILACLTNEPHRFPNCEDDAHSQRLTISASEAGELRFRQVQPGIYAIALLHDENENGRADRALSMIPREGFGFSRDAPVRMGPPSFNAAAITVGTSSLRQSIRMRYML